MAVYKSKNYAETIRDRMIRERDQIFCPDINGHCRTNCVCFLKPYVYNLISGEFVVYGGICKKYENDQN